MWKYYDDESYRTGKIGCWGMHADVGMKVVNKKNSTPPPP